MRKVSEESFPPRRRSSECHAFCMTLNILEQYSSSGLSRVESADEGVCATRKVVCRFSR